MRGSSGCSGCGRDSIVVFSGSTGALLPLYALSVFAAFTFSQGGMVKHWLRERGPTWRLKAVVNGVGAIGNTPR